MGVNKDEVSRKNRGGLRAWHIIVLVLVSLWVVCDLQKVGGPLHRNASAPDSAPPNIDKPYTGPGAREPAAPTASAPDTEPPHIDKPYAGPVGLKWGMSRAEVRAALRGQLAFVKEYKIERGAVWGPGIEQVYRGRFAGYAVDTFFVEFHDGKLTTILAILKEPDDRPASRRWLNLVKDTEEGHGAPSIMSEVPEVPGLSAAAQELSEHGEPKCYSRARPICRSSRRHVE